MVWEEESRKFAKMMTSRGNSALYSIKEGEYKAIKFWNFGTSST